MSYKKTRLIPSGHPNKKIQQDYARFIMNTVRKANHDNDVVVFLDPVHQVHNVENGYCWQIRGRMGTKAVLSNSGRERLTIVGAINATTRQPTLLITEDNCDQYLMAAFLAQIRKEYPHEKTIYVFLDNARYSHSKRVTMEAETLGIKLLFLPPYCPNLNLIERLWKFMKKKVTANQYYKTFGEFIRAIHNFFQCIGQYKTELDSLLRLKFEIL